MEKSRVSGTEEFRNEASMSDVLLRFIRHYSDRFIIERNVCARKPKFALGVPNKPKFELRILGNPKIGFRLLYHWNNRIYDDNRHLLDF